MAEGLSPPSLEHLAALAAARAGVKPGDACMAEVPVILKELVGTMAAARADWHKALALPVPTLTIYLLRTEVAFRPVTEEMCGAAADSGNVAVFRETVALYDGQITDDWIASITRGAENLARVAREVRDAKQQA